MAGTLNVMFQASKTDSFSKFSMTDLINPAIHFLAGGIGGTIGAVATCPLEVVKTRMQSTMYQNGAVRGLTGMLAYFHIVS